MLEVEVDLLDRGAGDQVGNAAVGAATVVVVAAGTRTGRAGAATVVVAWLIPMPAVVVADLVLASTAVIARLGLAAADAVAIAVATLVLAPNLGAAGDGPLRALPSGRERIRVPVVWSNDRTVALLSLLSSRALARLGKTKTAVALSATATSVPSWTRRPLRLFMAAS